jgi:hypothetical protein
MLSVTIVIDATIFRALLTDDPELSFMIEMCLNCRPLGPLLYDLLANISNIYICAVILITSVKSFIYFIFI